MEPEVGLGFGASEITKSVHEEALDGLEIGI